MNASTNSQDLVCSFCNKATLLRCCDCNHPLCIECAQRSPTGYICEACVEKLETVYYDRLYSSGKFYDYPIAFTASFLLAMALVPLIVFCIYAITLPKHRIGIGIGVRFGFGSIAAIATAVSVWWANLIRKFVKCRRSRYLKHITVSGVMLGVVSGALVISWLLQLEAIIICIIAFLLGFPFYRAVFNETTLI